MKKNVLKLKKKPQCTSKKISQFFTKQTEIKNREGPLNLADVKSQNHIDILSSDEDTILQTPSPKNVLKRKLSISSEKTRNEDNGEKENSLANENSPTFKKIKQSPLQESNSTPSKVRIISPKRLIGESLTSPDKKGSTSKDIKTKIGSPRALFVDNDGKCIDTQSLLKDKPIASTSKKSPQKTVKTPVKGNRTPGKLFNKSPNVKEFNVEIINNFVRVTPSKSNKAGKSEKGSVKKSTEKSVQKSILDYVSPAGSRRSKEAQTNNEFTPSKSGTSYNSSPMLKVKMRLDFSDEKPMKEPSISPKKKPVSPNLNDSFDLNDFEEAFEETWLENTEPSNFTLDLTESQHCTVVEVEKYFSKQQLIVESTKTKERALCNLEQFWFNANLQKGDTIHISAEKTSSAEWTLSNDKGLIVFEPDLLISSTSVVNSVFCMRRAVLKEKYSGLDPGNKVMMIGEIVHSLLGRVLKNNLRDIGSIQSALDEILQSKRTIKYLFANSLEVSDIQSELEVYIPKITNFVEQYVKNSSRSLEVKGKKQHNKHDWQGTIDYIEDIEENIWCPNLGIKGKVDVTIHNGIRTMPLELKTGRATMSVEHRGQVILYLMMMKQFGYIVDSGLLLYLKEGVFREVSMNHREKRDLTILRNELAYYLTRKPVINEDSNKVDAPELPEPINHPTACEKCPYNAVCCAYLSYENVDLSNNNSLRTLKDSIFTYLKASHIDYFIHWSNLLLLEFSAQDRRKSIKEIYTMKPEDREKKGKCITNVCIKSVSDESNDYYLTTFHKSTSHDEECSNFLASGLTESSYVVVSTKFRPAVATGCVTDICNNYITIALDRDLNKKYKSNIFHLDTYESNIGLSFNLANLSLLLDNSEKSEHLRKLIIDKSTPTYQLKLAKSVVTTCAPILKSLNKLQQRAVIKALTTNDYLLIKGMPGTGKTSTIVALIELLVMLDMTVLITSHTHAAVDNVCLRLKKKGVDFIRLGTEGRIHTELKSYSEHFLTKNCSTTKELDDVFNKVKVLAVTCIGSTHPILSKRIMDICIIDESTQVLQTTIIKVLSSSKKFILIGDPDQLSPVVRNTTAAERGLSQSLFERLHNETNTIVLTYNYRMNKKITELANVVTYKGELLTANEEVANATIHMPNKENLCEFYEPWLTELMEDSLEKSVQFVDTGPVWKLKHSIGWLSKTLSYEHQNEDNTRCTNPYETAIVVTIVKALLKCGVAKENFGVISPYIAQIAQLQYFLNPMGVDVNTVDQYQGQDREIIICSCTKSMEVNLEQIGDKKMMSIMDDNRRLTVAITRAKHKLILVGDIGTLKYYKPYENLFSGIATTNILNVNDESLKFDWNKVLNLSED